MRQAARQCDTRPACLSLARVVPRNGTLSPRFGDHERRALAARVPPPFVGRSLVRSRKSERKISGSAASLVARAGASLFHSLEKPSVRAQPNPTERRSGSRPNLCSPAVRAYRRVRAGQAPNRIQQTPWPPGCGSDGARSGFRSNSRRNRGGFGPGQTRSARRAEQLRPWQAVPADQRRPTLRRAHGRAARALGPRRPGQDRSERERPL